MEQKTETWSKKMQLEVDLYVAYNMCEKGKKYVSVDFCENLISSKYIFQLIFDWKGIYYGLLYHKTCLGIPIWPPKPLKTAKNVNFWKTEN